MQAVKSQIDAAHKVAGGNGSEQDIAEAKIELEVWFFLFGRNVFVPSAIC